MQQISVEQTHIEGLTVTEETSREFPARAEVLSDVRRMIEECGAKTVLTKMQIEDLLTAVDEAAANAIRHGSSKDDPDSRLRVLCQHAEAWIEVRIRDFGKGFAVPEVPAMPAPDAMGGRGLPLMVALADSVAVASSSTGTTVTLLKRASGDVHGRND